MITLIWNKYYFLLLASVDKISHFDQVPIKNSCYAWDDIFPTVTLLKKKIGPQGHVTPKRIF